MFQESLLDHGISHGKGFLTTDCSTLHPFSEVVLHDNDTIVAILSRFQRTHQI